MPQLRRPVPRADRVEIDGLDSDQTRYATGSRRNGKNARPVEIRNGMPFTRPYRYGDPRPRFAVEALRRAADEHGEPDD